MAGYLSYQDELLTHSLFRAERTGGMEKKKRGGWGKKGGGEPTLLEESERESSFIVKTKVRYATHPAIVCRVARAGAKKTGHYSLKDACEERCWSSTSSAW